MKFEQLYYVARKLRNWTEQAIEYPEGFNRLSISLYNWVILQDIMETPDTTIQEIAKRLSMAQSMVSQAIQRLKENNLIVAIPDQNDRRKVRLLPNEKVVHFIGPQLTKDAKDILYPLMVNFSEEEKDCVLKGLILLYESFKRLEKTDIEPENNHQGGMKE